MGDNRIPSLFQFTNSVKTNLFNTYTSGSGVGAVSSSNRRALIRRASLNRGTLEKPGTTQCSGFCAGGALQAPPGQSYPIPPPIPPPPTTASSEPLL